MKEKWKKMLLGLLVLGIAAGYSAFFVRAYADYNNSLLWAEERSQAGKLADNDGNLPADENGNNHQTADASDYSLQNREFGQITGHDWVGISADEKIKLISNVFYAMWLLGTSIEANEKEFITLLDSFYADDNRKSTDIVTATNYVGESQGLIISN